MLISNTIVLYCIVLVPFALQRTMTCHPREHLRFPFCSHGCSTYATPFEAVVERKECNNCEYILWGVPVFLLFCCLHLYSFTNLSCTQKTNLFSLDKSGLLKVWIFKLFRWVQNILSASKASERKTFYYKFERFLKVSKMLHGNKMSFHNLDTHSCKIAYSLTLIVYLESPCLLCSGSFNPSLNLCKMWSHDVWK